MISARRRLLFGAGLLLLATQPARAIFQMDVDASVFLPDGCDFEFWSDATLYLFGNPVPFLSTSAEGPDGDPPAMHYVFDYDDSIGGGTVDHVSLSAGGCCQEWTPPLFTVFYSGGPALPVAGEFWPFAGFCEFWPTDCDWDCDGDGEDDRFEAVLELAFPARLVPPERRPDLEAYEGGVGAEILGILGHLVDPAADPLRVRFDYGSWRECERSLSVVDLLLDEEIRTVHLWPHVLGWRDTLALAVDFPRFPVVPDRPVAVADLSARATATALELVWSPVDTTWNGLPLPDPVYRVAAADGSAGPFLPIGETAEPGFSDPWTVAGPSLRLYRVTVASDSLEP